MKICIFGAGAIGGYMGVKLAQVGANVSLGARGPHLKAMKKNGLRLIEEGNDTIVPVTASENPEDLGIQDYVVITLKAHSVPLIVNKMGPLINKKTTRKKAQNKTSEMDFKKVWSNEKIGLSAECLSFGYNKRKKLFFIGFSIQKMILLIFKNTLI